MRTVADGEASVNHLVWSGKIADMVKFSLASGSILTHKADALLLFLPSDKRLPESVLLVDKALDGLIESVRHSGDFSGKPSETLWLHTANATGFASDRVLLAGIGGDDEDARQGIDAAFVQLAQSPAKTALAVMPHLSALLCDYAVVAAARSAYRYQAGGHFPGAGAVLRRVAISPPRGFSAVRLAKTAAIGEGVQLTCHLAEQPGNICTPAFLAATARALAKKTSLRATMADAARIKNLGMGGLLGVAQGSALPPCLITLQHAGGGAKQAPIVLVGKGVTFDTGGISLKPAAAMDEMKFDMCGAATVFGVLLACARAKLPLNVVGVIPACENMPDGRSLKPGDVITAMTGKTIEVLNTDAEGRLILADALAYAEKYKPTAVIDIATLTGACIIALGNHTSGLMGWGDSFLGALHASGDASGDACWRLPLGKKYQRQLKTDYADMANIGGRAAGTITAACFLSRFVKCDNWAHLDIAGTAWTEKKRATGRPVPLLMHYLNEQATGKLSKAR